MTDVSSVQTPHSLARSSFSNMAESVPVEVTVQINSVTAINIKRILFDVDFTLMCPALMSAEFVWAKTPAFDDKTHGKSSRFTGSPSWPLTHACSGLGVVDIFGFFCQSKRLNRRTMSGSCCLDAFVCCSPKTSVRKDTKPRC